MEEGLPWCAWFIWKLDAKLWFGKDFLSNFARQHGHTESVFRKAAFHLNLKGPWENLGWTCNITSREQGMSLGMGLEQALGMCVGLIDVPRPYGAYGQAQSVWAMVSTCQQWEQKAEFRGVRIAHGSLPVQHWKSAQILLNFFFFNGISRHYNHLSMGWRRGCKRELMLQKYLS